MHTTNSYWVPDSSPLSQPATLGRTFFQVRRGVIPRTLSCWHVSKPLDQVSTSISERQQVYRRTWAPDSLCHVSTVTLLRDSSSMKHLRNSNLNRKPIWDQLKIIVKMSWLTFHEIVEWAPDLAAADVAASHFARTPAGNVSVFWRRRFNAPHCLFRSAWGIWEAVCKEAIASCCSCDKTLTLLTRLLSPSFVKPSMLTEE